MTASTLPRSTQVLVVGGGPAGSATAWYCAQAGLDVLLVDRSHFPRAKPCAEYVSPEGARILDTMGALDTLEARAAALTGMVVHAPSGERIHGEFVARHGFRGFRDRGLGIRREILDTVLVDRARANGVQVVEGAKVEHLVRDPATGRTTGVTLRTIDGVSDVRAALVIGADGLRSIVAKRLGLATLGRWPRRLAFVAHYRHVRDMSSLGEMHVGTSGYLGLADVGDGITNVALVVPARDAHDVHGDAEGFLLAWIAAHPAIAARFAGAERVSPVRATGPFASRAKRPWAAGAALVGDAADFYDPFTGEGIYAALRGAEVLAPFAVDAVHAGERGDLRGERRTLRAYESARHHVFAGKWRVERLIGTAVAFPALINGAARVLGRDRALADLLIGVTGDFVPASAIVAPRTIWRMIGGIARSVVAAIGGPESESPDSSPRDATLAAATHAAASTAAALASPSTPAHVHRS